MDTLAHLVDAVSVDAHIVLAQVVVDLHKLLVVLLVRNLRRGARNRGCVRRRRWRCTATTAGAGIAPWRADEILHVLEERQGLEELRWHAVDMGEEGLVQLALVGVRLHLLEPLRLLAVELLDVGRGRGRGCRRHGRRRWAPQARNDALGVVGGEVKLGAGILDGGVDSGLHFGRGSWVFRDGGTFVFWIWYT